jgi:hypothetical protein
MNTEMNSNMPMNNNNPSPKSNNVVLIVIIAIVLFAAGVLVGKYVLTTTEINKEENTNIKENTNTTDDSTTIEVDKYAEYLENLEASMNKSYTAYTHPKIRVSNEMLSLTYIIKITNDNELMLDSKKVADDVVSMFVVPNGNGGFNSLYFINKEGKLSVAKHEEYLYNKETTLSIESLDYENIVNVTSGIQSTDGMAGTYTPIFTDIDGNVFIGE